MESQRQRRTELWYGEATLETIFADLEALAQGLAPGELLALHTNAEQAWEAIPHWCRAHGCAIGWKSDTWEGVREGAPAYRVTRYTFHIQSADPNLTAPPASCT